MKTQIKQRIKQAVATVASVSGVTRRRRTGGLVILMLHKVNDGEDPLTLTIAPETLRSVLGEITASGHEIVSLDEWLTNPEADAAAPARFALTFDDGYRDNFENALPILREFDAPATVYVSVDFINGTRQFWYEKLTAAVMTTEVAALDLTDLQLARHTLGTETRKRETLLFLNNELKTYSQTARENAVTEIVERLETAGADYASPMLSWDMIRTMTESGVTIGAHTMSHPILSRETRDRVRTEVAESKRVIEENTGKTVEAFAYPNGRREDFNDMVIEEVCAAGYTSACTTITGRNDPSTDPMQLKRVNLQNGICLDHRGRFNRSLFWSKVLQVF